MFWFINNLIFVKQNMSKVWSITELKTVLENKLGIVFLEK